MVKSVFGIFDSSSEVQGAINILKAKGYDSGDITIVADKEDRLDFFGSTEKTDVKTITTDEDTYDDTFMDKVMRFLTNEGTFDLKDQLENSDLSDREISAYMSDVDEGKLLVLVDKEEDQDDLLVNSVHSSREDGLNPEGSIETGVTENPDPNIFPNPAATAELDNAHSGSRKEPGSPEVHSTTGTEQNLVAGSGRLNTNAFTAIGKDGDDDSGSRSKTKSIRDKELEIEKKKSEEAHYKEKLDPEEDVQMDSDDNPIVHDDLFKNRINTDHL
jgi:hypothetical protein